jgi:FlaA1/EpsC-like NDP-sugar epimerase
MVAFVGAFFLRFDFGRVPEDQLPTLGMGLPLMVVIRMITLWGFKVHRGLYRYTSMHDVLLLFKAVTAGSLVFIPLWLVTGGHQVFMPRSIYFLDWILCLTLLVGVRASVRLWRTHFQTIRASGAAAERALVVGAGNLGETILRIVDRRFFGQDLDVVGFVDQNPIKHGGRIHGVPVLGDTKDVREFIKEHRIDVVLFAISEPRDGLFEEIVASCDGLHVRFNTVSLLTDASTGEVRVERMRGLKIEDLLGRKPVEVDVRPVRQGLAGQTILVSGAGGSIGSELCRQISSFGPQRIVLLDAAESPLFEIDRELRELHPELDIYPVIGDIKHAEVVERVFAETKPAFVYHAAAYKHVPLMQTHPDEAVLNNVRGTRHLAEAARRHACKRFVMISTDKAVRPTNVMGATKRMCELLIQSMNGTAGKSAGTSTVFAAVRFGNVLGSNGSVIPIFQKQIDAGGPISVTHPEMTRYFMTIPEAVSLVLQCGIIAEPRDIFVLDMGTPVKIMDLARNMIRLSGLREGVDISIKITGLRPGEKMYEELVAYGEELKPTFVPKINVLKQADNPLANEVLFTAVRHLEELARGRHTEKVKELLYRLIGFDAELNQRLLTGFSEKSVHQLIDRWPDAVEIPPVEWKTAPKGRVLAVVGQRELGIMLREVLASVGYEVDSLDSVAEALKLLSSDRAYSAVLCDVIMPHSTAWELNERIVAMRLDLPVIAMSEYDCKTISELLEVDICMPILRKPFSPHEFDAALNSFSDPAENVAPEPRDARL